MNHGSGRIGATVALATTAGVVAAAAPAAAQAPAPATLLKPGTSGPSVKRVQHALHIKRTGRFSRGTEHAVVAYQRRDGLMVDGIVGPQTWDSLFGIAPQPAGESPAAAGASAPAASSGSGGYTIPSSIVQCESGGNYSAVNPDTGAGGAYQILPSTWQAYGGQGLPQDASPAEQGRIAGEIYASQGGSAWSC
jgi:peptidoglycan hydrolase-like protein with peptidoglycan-binding domain